MLSVPKESPEVRAGLELGASSPFISFLNVVDSIQDLNQLLEDISLEKIIDADKKAKQLIQHLALLQEDLTKLKEIKHSLSKSQQPGISNVNKTPLDTAPETADKPSIDRPSALPKNLIPFPASPRILKVKKEPPPLQSAPPFTTPVETEEKQDQKRDSDEGAGFCLGTPLDNKTSSPSFYIPSNPRSKEEEPDRSDSKIQPRGIAEPPCEIIPRRFKSEGDLDRKLKTIVRDYGAVDIYSYRNKDNIKRKALIVTLILLLGYFASSFFFPFHQKEESATALRLQPSVTTGPVKVPGPAKSIDPASLNRRDLPTSFSVEPAQTNKPERDFSDL